VRNAPGFAANIAVCIARIFPFVRRTFACLLAYRANLVVVACVMGVGVGIFMPCFTNILAKVAGGIAGVVKFVLVSILIELQETGISACLRYIHAPDGGKIKS
jgi:hypothetical protein